jgi:hypothetical protein
MVRLGYVNCAACHFAPQGGGPLNAYGRGIDRAQSLRGGEYQPATGEFVRTLNAAGRITHDLRAVLLEQAIWAGSQPATNFFRPRLMYRNVTAISQTVHVSATVTADGERVRRPGLAYDPPARGSALFVNTALVQFRPRESFEVAAGRDQLPTGINIPDLGVYVKARNRLGYYDSPTQLKAFWWGKHHGVTAFAYGPGGNEATGEREWGGGSLVEVDVLGNQRTILGASYLRGTAANGDRQTVGAYTRLGFGRWGILAEHAITDRSRELPTTVSFRQNATYGQLFWAVREWLVLSAIGERLQVASPFELRLMAGKLEVATRLASQATIVASTRVERNMSTGRLSRTVSLQLALKTVD